MRPQNTLTRVRLRKIRIKPYTARGNATERLPSSPTKPPKTSASVANMKAKNQAHPFPFQIKPATISAKTPKVNHATAIGTIRKLYEEDIPTNENAKELGSRNARKIKNPNIRSMIPTIICRIVSAVTLAGRIDEDTIKVKPRT